MGCRSLKKLEIPEGVMIIERSAFYNCVNLENVYVPESVVSLKEIIAIYTDDYSALIHYVCISFE